MMLVTHAPGTGYMCVVMITNYKFCNLSSHTYVAIFIFTQSYLLHPHLAQRNYRLRSNKDNEQGVTGGKYGAGGLGPGSR